MLTGDMSVGLARSPEKSAVVEWRPEGLVLL